MVIARQAPQICLPMIPLSVRFCAVHAKASFRGFPWTTWSTTFNVASWWYLGGASMATIEGNSNDSDPVHDFAWHRTHRARRGGQLIDVVTLAGWAALVGWVMLLH